MPKAKEKRERGEVTEVFFLGMINVTFLTFYGLQSLELRNLLLENEGKADKLHLMHKTSKNDNKPFFDVPFYCHPPSRCKVVVGVEAYN